MKTFQLLILLLAIQFTAKAQTPTKAEVYYEIFIRSFADSNKDGIGDINGITNRLDYLKSLGVTGIWITPVHPSPTYHKYDVVDYTGIDPEYGTLADYKKMVKEAHQRGIKILLDLVVNHTSSRHPWFLAACKNDPVYKNYYVWSDTVKTAANWHSNPLNPGEKYYGFFWEGMPDLNFDNPAVRAEVKKIGCFWLKEIGIDGFRLDAAQHIYEATDIDKNNAWWTEFREEMVKANPKMILIGEVWNKDSVVASYLKTSLDGCFNFDLSKALVNALQTNSSEGLTERIMGIHQLYQSYNHTYIDPTFISNHDQDRYRSTFQNDTAKTQLVFAMLMTLPGTPFLYYGEELGMLGKFPDHYRREPMIWGTEETTTWEKPQFTLSTQTQTAKEQMKTPNSFYTAYKQLIYLRKTNRLFWEGEVGVSPLAAKLGKDVWVYELKKDNRKCTVVYNISAQAIKIPKSPTSKLTLLNGASLQNMHIVLPAYSGIILE